MVYRSSNCGSSVSGDFWQKVAMNSFVFSAFFTSLSVEGRPTVTGVTTPGKSTMLRIGRIGTSPSKSKLVVLSTFIAPSDMMEMLAG